MEAHDKYRCLHDNLPCAVMIAIVYGIETGQPRWMGQ